MKKTLKFKRLHSLWLFLVLPLFISTCTEEDSSSQMDPVAESHPFESYLNQDDGVYQYEIKDKIENHGYTTYIVRMVSQRWLNEDQVDEPQWWHWLTLVVPDEVEHDTGFLWIGGGSRNDDQPNEANRFIVEAALATNSVAADLHNVPFQPIHFAGDTLDHRYEDELIAYGWREFLESGANDEYTEWLARLPMTKAVIRAMDTITDLTSGDSPVKVGQFVIAGASKRGWTTWTTAVFDDRVVAISPVVIDLLNIIPSFQHHWRAYGEWSPAIIDYENENIMGWQSSEEYARMLELVDPYSYLDRLELPKFILNAGSDEFFLPDSWKFYWEDLRGDKYLRYVPNTGHSMSDTDAMESLLAFYEQILTDTPIPGFSWHVEDDTIILETDPDTPPEELKLWTATNSEDRDFRLFVIDKTWESHVIEMNEEGRYRIEIEKPEEGFRAGFVEATWRLESFPLKLTSGTVVVPDTYPYPPFETETPRGSM